MKKFFGIRTIILFFFALTACGLASAQQTITGTSSDGAVYEFAVPGGWNGTLVVYAHGIIDPAAPIALPAVNDDFAPLRDALLSQGYAVASSSWSENGYAVADGFKQTHQLTGLFTAQVQRPTKTILIGKSLGGLVVAKLAERYPKQYDGALAMCGVVGGSSDEVKYLADARILFDYFFPGVMPGDAFHSPTLDFSPGSPTFNAVLQAAEIGFFDPRQPTLQLFSTARLPASNPTEIITSILQTLGFNTRFGNDLLAHTQNHVPYDNRGVLYSGSANDLALNLGVERFAAQPDAVEYLEHNYDPTGVLQIPVLTLHNVLDPVVPTFNELNYAGRVATAGASDLLVQQQVASYGHCNFTTQEQMNSFNALALWVSNPVQKPVSGDVTLP